MPGGETRSSSMWAKCRFNVEVNCEITFTSVAMASGMVYIKSKACYISLGRAVLFFVV